MRRPARLERVSAHTSFRGRVEMICFLRDAIEADRHETRVSAGRPPFPRGGGKRENSVEGAHQSGTQREGAEAHCLPTDVRQPLCAGGGRGQSKHVCAHRGVARRLGQEGAGDTR